MLLRDYGESMKRILKRPALRGSSLFITTAGSDRKEITMNRSAGPPLSSSSSLQSVEVEAQADYDRYGDQFEYLPLKKKGRRKKRKKTTHPTVNTLIDTSESDKVENSTKLPTSSVVEKFPHYFIIGFAKTGTKALYELLKLHPQLTGPRREMRFFTSQDSRSLDTYLSHFPLPPAANGYTIEKSPDYVLSLPAATRIKEAATENGIDESRLKFVVMVRNPVARTVSDYLEMVLWSYVHKKPALLPFESTVITPEGSVNDSINIINSSCYSFHLKRWYSIFKREQFCIVDGDRFVTEPYVEAKALEECLGLKPFFAEDHFVYNSRRKFYCFKVSSSPVCMNRAKGRPHPPVSDEAINKLKDHFKSYNEELYSLIGRDFKWENSMKY